MVMDLPSCADVDGTFTSELIKEYMNLKVHFKDQEIKFPDMVKGVIEVALRRYGIV